MRKTLSFPSQPKFLIDENVRIELIRFLKTAGFNTKSVPKGITDQQLAYISKKEKRILVTNDSDFTDPELYSCDELFALILLRIPQSEGNKLVISFKKFLTEYNDDYAGKLILLFDNSWEIYNLMRITKFAIS